MPLRKMDFISSEFALAEPVPFTVAILIAKSLTWELALAFEGVVVGDMLVLRDLRFLRLERPPFIEGVRPVHDGFLHIPRGRRAALGTQATVHAEVFVFHHYARRLLQRCGNV